MHAIFAWRSAKRLTGIAAALCFALMLFTHGSVAADSVERSVLLCGRVLLPSLFPFFIVSSLLGEYLPGSVLSRLAGKVFQKLFHLPGDCFFVPIMGALGGYPVGAKLAAQFFRDGRCSENEAVRLLVFSNNAGPAFVIGAIGTGLLHDRRTGLLLLGAHLFTSWAIGLIYSAKSTTVKTNNFTDNSKEPSFISALLHAVTDGFSAFLTVCAFVIFFGIVIDLLRRCIPFPAGAAPAVLLGCLEMTTGISMLCAAPLSPLVRLPAIAFLLGWGGASVQLQTVQLLRQGGLPCGAYLLAKLVQGMASALAVFAAAVLLQ